jgi:hypothetical protein
LELFMERAVSACVPERERLLSQESRYLILPHLPRSA